MAYKSQLSRIIGRYAGLRWVEFCPFSELPDLPCCYAIQQDGVTIYVGQTLDLRSRMYDHRRTWLNELPGIVRMKVRFGERYGDWAMREARLIRRLSPEWNQRAA